VAEEDVVEEANKFLITCHEVREKALTALIVGNM
jgi:hypothetical protein